MVPAGLAAEEVGPDRRARAVLQSISHIRIFIDLNGAGLGDAAYFLAVLRQIIDLGFQGQVDLVYSLDKDFEISSFDTFRRLLGLPRNTASHRSTQHLLAPGVRVRLLSENALYRSRFAFLDLLRPQESRRAVMTNVDLNILSTLQRYEGLQGPQLQMSVPGFHRIFNANLISLEVSQSVSDDELYGMDIQSFDENQRRGPVIDTLENLSSEPYAVFLRRLIEGRDRIDYGVYYGEVTVDDHLLNYLRALKRALPETSRRSGPKVVLFPVGLTNKSREAFLPGVIDLNDTGEIPISYYLKEDVWPQTFPADEDRIYVIETPVLPQRVFEYLSMTSALPVVTSGVNSSNFLLSHGQAFLSVRRWFDPNYAEVLRAFGDFSPAIDLLDRANRHLVHEAHRTPLGREYDRALVDYFKQVLTPDSTDIEPSASIWDLFNAAGEYYSDPGRNLLIRALSECDVLLNPS